MPENNEALLKRIRDRYKYAMDEWREIRQERMTDMRYIAGDPWDDEDKKARAEAGRPCISHDELNQYVNQAVNNLRMNKRAIKITPAGEGATDQTAEFHANLIRSIEYQSQGQSAYITAAEAAICGSYGFFRIGREYVSDKSFDQRITIGAILNPDSVVYDPDCKKPDWSDARYVFVLDPLPKDEFIERYPKAEKVSFSADDMKVASEWIQGDTILTAEYWEAETTSKKLYLLESGEVVDTLPEGQKAKKSRRVDVRKITQYITNGVEILETNPQPGEYIGIIPVIGKEMYVDEGSGPKRKLFSLVRLGRDPQMSLAYLCSQQMEEAGLTPKTPYIGYKGQFESDAKTWETVTRIPHAFVQADPVIDEASGQLLPLPRREQFTPNFQEYEAAKESCRRAVQSAMGIMPMPTVAQEQNQKSGKALSKIDQQQQIGSFHFVDNFDRALQFAGRVIEDLIPIVYDTERTVSLLKPDDSHQLAQINAPQEDGQTLDPTEGEHAVTISTGPSNESQREAFNDFLDTLVGNLQALPMPGTPPAKVLALSIRGRQLGPRGDQIADIFDPPQQGMQNLPPQVQGIVQQSQMEVQQLKAQLMQLLQDKQGKVIEHKGKMEQIALQHQSDMELERLKLENQLAIAEVQTKAQSAQERADFVREMEKQFHMQAHDVGQQAVDHAHERGMTAVQQAHEQQQAAATQEHDQNMAQTGAVIQSAQSAQDAAQQQ